MALEQKEWDVVIIGGGIAAVSAANSLTQNSTGMSVLILNEEDRQPYRRTKISKFMARGFSKNELEIQPQSWYRSENITVEPSRVVEIDPVAHTLFLEDGPSLSWKTCILATGAEPKLPGLDPDLLLNPRVHTIRRARDAEMLRSAVLSEASASVLVVGLGVLGVEVAEQLRLLGAEVIAVEAGPGPMWRELKEQASIVLSELFERLGIKMYVNEHISIDARGQGLRVGLKKTELSPKMIVFCTGTEPRKELAVRSGLKTDHGIVVDQFLRTSHPDIYAAGDTAQHPGGELTHLWHAAELQGSLAGSNAAGSTLIHENPPFRLKCEVGGHYFFSIGKLDGAEQVHEQSRNGIYQYFAYHGQRCVGAVMIDDKPRADHYIEAVLRNWRRRRVERALALQ